MTFHILTSALQPQNGIQPNFIRRKISTSSTTFVFFRTDRKTTMAALAPDWLIHFRLYVGKCPRKFNQTDQKARYQRLLPRLCFWPDQKSEMSDLASDFLRYFAFKPTEMSKGQSDNTNTATKRFDYTAAADRGQNV